MTSLGFIAPPPPKILGPPLNLDPPPLPDLIFCSGPSQLFWSEIFRSPLKIRGAATMKIQLIHSTTVSSRDN